MLSTATRVLFLVLAMRAIAAPVAVRHSAADQPLMNGLVVRRCTWPIPDRRSPVEQWIQASESAVPSQLPGTAAHLPTRLAGAIDLRSMVGDSVPRTPARLRC